MPGSTRGARDVAGERRTVTALFCDVTGSTAMAEQLDPEEWTGIMNEAFAYMTGPVDRYEGTVTRLMGDAILAFFGAPKAHEEDPQRAVLAALDIIAGVGPFKEEIKAEYGFDFDLRVGINTGPVVVGDVGSTVASEYTVMGDAVNVAARMEQTAEPGTVQITDATYKLVAPLFDVESLGGIEVKGKTEPVPAYRVLAPKVVPGRVRGIRGLDSPVVGRDAELATMREVVDDVRRGRGQIVALVGEAGLGKSRLIAEARAQWDEPTEDAPTWLEGRGIAYDMGRPYGLFLQIARRGLGVGDDDTPDVVSAKVAAVLPAFAPQERARIVQSVQMLLSVRKESPQELELQGEAVKRDLFTAVLESTRYLALATPRVMVFDDLQWSDSASVELLLELFALTEHVPLLIVCAFRPEQESPAWRVKRRAETVYAHRYTELVLGPLSDDDAERLIDNLLTISDLPADLRSLVLQKSEGNPFFVEEVVRTLIDSGAVVRDESGMHWHAETNVSSIAIPDNLQALLISRIDRLEEATRHTLQLASVIGRYFPYRVLRSVSETVDALDRHLGTLQGAELIRETAQPPEIEYIFRHELTRQAAYDSILRRRRSQFHQRVGEAIEQIYTGRLDDEAHRLAYHFSEAKDDERTLKYATMAGDAAARLYANDEAAGHYARALEVAVRTGVPEAQVIALYTKHGRTLELATRHDEALDSYRELEALGAERGSKAGSKALVLAALIPQATLFSTLSAKSDPELGQEVSKRALDIATEIGDAHGQTKSLWNLMLASYYFGTDSDTTIRYGDQAIEIARSSGLKEELAYALNDIARPLFDAGQLERGTAALAESAELWRELANLPMLADNLDSAATYAGFNGDFETAAPDRGVAGHKPIDWQPLGRVGGTSDVQFHGVRGRQLRRGYGNYFAGGRARSEGRILWGRGLFRNDARVGLRLARRPRSCAGGGEGGIWPTAGCCVGAVARVPRRSRACALLR